MEEEESKTNWVYSVKSGNKDWYSLPSTDVKLGDLILSTDVVDSSRPKRRKASNINFRQLAGEEEEEEEIVPEEKTRTKIEIKKKARHYY